MINKLTNFNPLAISQESQSEPTSQAPTTPASSLGIASAPDGFETVIADQYSALLRKSESPVVAQPAEGPMVDAGSVFNEWMTIESANAAAKRKELEERLERRKSLQLKIEELQEKIRALQQEIEEARENGDDDRVADLLPELGRLSAEMEALQLEIASLQKQSEEDLNALQKAMEEPRDEKPFVELKLSSDLIKGN